MIWKKKKDASAEAAETAEAKSGVSAFAKKNWKWLVPVVVVAAAGAVFLIGGGNKAASGDVTYAETTPVRQDVSNSLSGTGTLNPANTYTVKSLVDGKILTGGFEEGDKVEEGDVLYTIDSSDASTNLEKASIALQQAQRSYDKTVDLQYVRAEVDGTVSSLKVAKGDQVTSGQEVAVIRDSSKMLLNLLFPAADAASFSVYHHIGQCLAPCTENVPVEEYASLIHRVELLLSGRSRELLDTLRHAMADASEAMNYEQAAVFRDQIKAIERTVERQSVVLPEGGNMDVAGVAPAKGGLALGLLFVREGRLVDGRTFFWPDLELAEGPELLWSFLGQFYGPQTSIPPRIVVPWLPEDTVLPGMSGEQDAQDSASPAKVHIATLEGEAEPPHAAGTDSNGHAPDEVESLEALEAALADARGGIVRIAKPRNAAEARLVDMAVSNAREAAVTKSEVPMSDRLAAAFALDKVQSALPGAVPMASRPIRRIECVDVSHTGGTSTRVGMVVFEDGQPQKSDYRTYALEGEAACNGDDYAALAEWMRRRLESGPPWADLVLIDGGRGQVSAVQRIVRESNAEGLFLLAGIAKARDDMGRADRRAGNVGDRIFLPGRSNPLPLRDGSAELLFLQHIRDTAHHFVIGRHRRARAGAALSAELLRIPGVGKATARLLWDHFKALDAIIAATPAQLAAIPGIGPRKAEALAGSLKRLKE